MTRAARILVVDEDESLTHLVSLALELEGWQVRVAPTGAEALEAIVAFQPDLVLLDMMLPDVQGTEVVSDLRERGVRIPVVFLTGRAEHEARAAGYAAGGDGYVTKPFGLDELVDHLYPIVRRLGLASTSRRVGDLVVDVAAGQAWRGDEYLPLTPLEFELLRELVERPGKRMTLGELLRAVTVRGIRVPREFAQRMLERMGRLVNGDRGVLLLGDDSGWVLQAG